MYSFVYVYLFIHSLIKTTKHPHIYSPNIHVFMYSSLDSCIHILVPFSYTNVWDCWNTFKEKYIWVLSLCIPSFGTMYSTQQERLIECFNGVSNHNCYTSEQLPIESFEWNFSPEGKILWLHNTIAFMLISRSNHLFAQVIAVIVKNCSFTGSWKILIWCRQTSIFCQKVFS